MNSRLALIRQQRKLLQLRSRSQRLALAEAMLPWHRTLRIADTARSIWSQMREHPLLHSLAMFFMLYPQRNKIGVWASRLVSVLEIVAMMRSQRSKRD